MLWGVFPKKISKIQPNRPILARFSDNSANRLVSGMRTKKRENDLSSEGRNFFLKQAIFNLQSSAETCVYALPCVRKSSKNSNWKRQI